MAKTVAKATKKKKIRKDITKGIVHVRASFNNTIISITDEAGNVLSWGSSGASGFKGSRKSTPYAAQIAAEGAVERAKVHGLSEAEVLVKGIGSGRETAIRAIQNSGVYVKGIKDVTPIPHNGCRPKKPRRV